MFDDRTNKTRFPLEILDRAYAALKVQIARSVELGLASEDFSARFQDVSLDSHRRRLGVADLLVQDELIHPGSFDLQSAAGFDPHGEASRKIHLSEMVETTQNLRFINKNYAAGRLSQEFAQSLVNYDTNLQQIILRRFIEDLEALPLLVKTALETGLITEAESQRISALPFLEEQAEMSVELRTKLAT